MIAVLLGLFGPWWVQLGLVGLFVVLVALLLLVWAMRLPFIVLGGIGDLFDIEEDVLGGIVFFLALAALCWYTWGMWSILVAVLAVVFILGGAWLGDKLR